MISLTSVISAERSSKENYVVVGTHDGVFQPDEVLATAALLILYVSVAASSKYRLGSKSNILLINVM